MHSYLYEPRPSVGRYYLSNNIWRDAFSTAPWATDLTKLFDQNVVLAGLRTLVPYFTFTGDTQYEYLTPLDADQQNLQQAKQDGDDVAGTPFTAMHTQTAMDYLDANPAKFKRGGSCYTTIPDLEVVVEKHYAWDLPLIVGGVATNNAGRPWGFLASVNDVFKTAQSDEDQEGPLHFIHPDILGRGLSYTSIHELSHFLGLAHPHDTIGLAKVDTDFDGTTDTTEYWDGFSWTFDSTAAPTTYAFDQLTYSILDQENIARGHLSYYLDWTREALTKGGDAFAAQGLTTTAQCRRQTALDNLGEGAEALRQLRLRERDVRGAGGVDRSRRLRGPRSRASARDYRGESRDGRHRRWVVPEREPEQLAGMSRAREAGPARAPP